MRGIRRRLRETGLVSYLLRQRRWVSILLCLAVSFFLWIVVALGNTSGYTKEVRIRLLMPQLRGDYIVTDASGYPEELSVQIHADGPSLLRHTMRHLFGRRQTLRPSIDTLMLTHDEAGGEWRLSPEELKTLVLSRTMPDVRAFVTDTVHNIRISPSSIALRYMPASEREAVVIFDGNIRIVSSDAYIQANNIAVVPSRIKVYGTERRLRELEDHGPITIQTDTSTVVVSDGTQRSVRMALLPPEGIGLQRDSVDVRYDAMELQLYARETDAIEVRHLPEGYQLQLIPSSVSLTYLVQHDTDEPSDSLADQDIPFELYVDASQIGSDASRLKVRLSKLPNHVTMVKLVPDSVGFILTKSSRGAQSTQNPNE